MTLVYLLDADVFRDAEEKNWVDGVRAVFGTQAGAYAYFKAWVDGREYAIDTDVDTYGKGRFLGDDVEGFDSEGSPCFVSWGINTMEVRQ